MEDTVFLKIIRHEIPAEIVYEDDDTLAFLDIHPINPGHTLVVPKQSVRNIFDIETADFTKVMETVRKLSPVIRDAVGAEGLSIRINNEKAGGQDVFHLHVHIIPRFKDDGYAPWHGKSYANGEAQKVAEKIRTQLAK